MHTVRQILEAKGGQVWSVHPHASVYDALQIMANKEIGALLVMDGGDVRGVLSERDYARKVILTGRSSKDTCVADIMSEEVLVTSFEQNIADCMALMTDKKIRHLPVLDGGRVAGIISIGDLVKAIIAEQEFVIEQLENYIGGVTA
ncbi:MAG: CBS domain-containing protein [Pseudomonadota bacterium]